MRTTRPRVGGGARCGGRCGAPPGAENPGPCGPGRPQCPRPPPDGARPGAVPPAVLAGAGEVQPDAGATPSLPLGRPDPAALQRDLTDVPSAPQGLPPCARPVRGGGGRGRQGEQGGRGPRPGRGVHLDGRVAASSGGGGLTREAAASQGGLFENMGGLMESVKKAQALVSERAVVVQKELAAAEYEGFSADETVRVVVSGNQEPRGCDITEAAMETGAEVSGAGPARRRRREAGG